MPKYAFKPIVEAALRYGRGARRRGDLTRR